MNTPPPLPVTAAALSEDDVSAYLNQPLRTEGWLVAGTEGMTIQQIEDDVLRGGRFRIFRYNFSVIVLSFQRGTEMRYFRAGQGTGAHAWPWTLLSMVVGWWGFPWGILFTFQTIFTNSMGGKDVTPAFLGAIVGEQRAAGIMAQAHKPQADMMLWLLRIFVLLIPLGIYAAIAGAEHTPR